MGLNRLPAPCRVDHRHYAPRPEETFSFTIPALSEWDDDWLRLLASKINNIHKVYVEISTFAFIGHTKGEDRI